MSVCATVFRGKRAKPLSPMKLHPRHRRLQKNVRPIGMTLQNAGFGVNELLFARKLCRTIASRLLIEAAVCPVPAKAQYGERPMTAGFAGANRSCGQRSSTSSRARVHDPWHRARRHRHRAQDCRLLYVAIQHWVSEARGSLQTRTLHDSLLASIMSRRSRSRWWIATPETAVLSGK